MNDLGRRIRGGVLAVLCLSTLMLSGIAVPFATAGGIVLPLAQAQGTPPAVMPANVQKVGRMYVVESVVLIVLFGGAIYAVCRTSRRT